MKTGVGTSASRGVFAAAIFAAHLLFAYFLVVPLRHLTSRIPAGGEAVMLLLPGDTRDSKQSIDRAEVEPQLEEPQVVWVPMTPDLAIDYPQDSVRQTAEAQLGSGRADVPETVASEAGIAVLRRVLPEYPIESVRAGEEGSAVLQVLVDQAGHASEVRVVRSTGYGRLDDSSVKAVSRWQFAPATKGALPVQAWGEMEMRFNLYRFSVSRIVDAPLDLVPPGEILNAARVPAVPGGEKALRALIEEVRTADADAFDAPWLRDELKRMRGALAGWGEPDAIVFQRAAAGNRWRSYEVRPEFRKSVGRETVELRWDVYDVTHDHGYSEWRIAIDREGHIWCAQADSVRPGSKVLQVSR